MIEQLCKRRQNILAKKSRMRANQCVFFLPKIWLSSERARKSSYKMRTFTNPKQQPSNYWNIWIESNKSCNNILNGLSLHSLSLSSQRFVHYYPFQLHVGLCSTWKAGKSLKTEKKRKKELGKYTRLWARAVQYEGWTKSRTSRRITTICKWHRLGKSERT